MWWVVQLYLYLRVVQTFETHRNALLHPFYCEVCRISSPGDCWFLALGQLKVLWHRWRPFRPSVLMSLLPRMVRRFSDHGRPPLVSYGQISSPPNGFTWHMHRGSKSWTSCTATWWEWDQYEPEAQLCDVCLVHDTKQASFLIILIFLVICMAWIPSLLTVETACDQAVMDHPEMQELVQTDQPSAVIMGSALGRVAWILEAV